MTMTIEQLQELLTDERVKVSLHDGVYYAEVVEENGDVFGLAQSTTVDDLHQQLREAGVANRE